VIIRFLGLALCLGCCTAPLIAQDVDGWDFLQANSLRGIDNLVVQVYLSNENPSDLGLTRETLLEYMEMRLRQSRVGVLSFDEAVETGRTVFLRLEVLALLVGDRGWVHRLDLQVLQEACIRASPPDDPLHGCLLVGTWSNGTLNVGSSTLLMESIREQLTGLMDGFLNDYVLVNP